MISQYNQEPTYLHHVTVAFPGGVVEGRLLFAVPALYRRPVFQQELCYIDGVVAGGQMEWVHVVRAAHIWVWNREIYICLLYRFW